jgi:DNA-binding LytR/AlgR family response regulator
MKKILIVEDDFDLASNIKEILETLNYEVINIFSNSKDVLDFLEKEIPDLILMDILIRGDLDGIDLAYLIREKYPISLVFLTAYHNQNILNRISKVTYDGYLLKPYSIERLQSTIFLALKSFEEVSKKKIISRTLKIRDKGFMVPVSENDIIFLKADGLYTRVFTHSKNYIIRNILKEVTRELSDDKFIRIHKSYTINIEQITSFNAKEVIIGENIIPLRRGVYRDLKFLTLTQKEDSKSLN